MTAIIYKEYRVVPGTDQYTNAVWRVVEYQFVCLGGRGTFFKAGDANEFIGKEIDKDAENAVSGVFLEEAPGRARIRALEAEVLELRNYIQAQESLAAPELEE